MALPSSSGSRYHYRDYQLEELMKACRNGELKRVKHLLVHEKIPLNHSLGPARDITGSKGNTPLSAVAELGNVEVMKLLFEHGADPNFVSGTTYGFYEKKMIIFTYGPLSLAAGNGHYEAAELLLLKGAKVDVDQSQMSPLDEAAKHGHSKLVKLLLDNGAKCWEPRSYALYLACKYGYTECSRLLIEHGADINHRHCGIMFYSKLHVSTLELTRTVDDSTPLISAVKNTHIECTKLLLEKGANVHVPDSHDNTPLMVAAGVASFDSERHYTFNIKLVQLLLEHDTSMESRANVLYLACQRNYTEVAEVLVKYGTDVICFPEKALKTLWDAIKRNKSNVVSFLLQNGLVVNTGVLSSVIESRSLTLISVVLQNTQKHLLVEMNEDLIQAAVDEDHNFTEIVLPHAHDINVPLKSGNTALIEATRRGKEEHVKLLLKHSAQCKVPNKNGSTALMEAAERGFRSIVELLLEYDTDISNRANALYKACSHHRLVVVELLIKSGTNVNHIPEKASNALVEMIERKYFDIAHLLIQNEAPIDARSLSLAIKSRNPTLMSAVLQNTEKHLLVEMNGDLIQAAIDGDTNFAEAILTHIGHAVQLKSGNILKRKHFNAAQFLIENKINFKVDITQETLSSAIKSRNPTLMSVVLQNAEEHLLVEMNNDLVQVAMDGNYDFTKVVLPHVRDFDVQLKSGNTFLMEIIERKSSDIANLLIQNRIKVPITPFSLTCAIKSKNPTLISYVLQNAEKHLLAEMNDDLVQAAVDGDINLRRVILPHVQHVQLKSGSTTVMKLLEEKHLDIPQFLFDSGATIDTSSLSLTDAIKSRNPTIMGEVLLNAEEHLLVEMNDDLIQAAVDGEHEFAEVILRHVRDINVQLKSGNTALMEAARRGKESHVKLLLNLTSAQQSVNMRNKNGYTALMLASQGGHTKCVEHLVEAKDIDLNIQDDSGCTALMIACKNGHTGVVETLVLDYATYLNILDNNGCSALFHSVKSNSSAIVKMLIEEGADVHQLTPDGKDILQFIREQNKKPGHRMIQTIQKAKGKARTNTLEEHIAAVEKAIEEKGTLKHTLSHGVMVGPARSGKSSLMSRLAGEMPLSDSPSTGVADKVIQVVGVRKSYSIAIGAHKSIRCQKVVWFKLLYDQEAIRLMKLATQNITSQPQQPATTQLTDIVITQPTSNLMQSEGTSPMEQSHVSDPLSTTEQSVTTPFLKEDYTTPYPEGYIPPMEVFKAAIEGKGLESLRQHFENSWSFYLTDTGGQVEFQEVIPLLVSGPSVFFFTFRLDQDLNQRFTIEYHLPEGGRSKPYQSTLTVVEAILQTLASVASMGTFTYKGPQVKSIELKPKMFIVGTHKDKLNPTTVDSEIMKIDQFLQGVIKPTSYYEEEIIQFASESQLIYTVNNFSKSDSDFKKIQLGVERVVFHSEFKVHFPTHWLIFSLVLRQEIMTDSIISYDQCFSIAKDCGITDTEELDHALWFLHTKIGLIRHFPTPGLQEFVIRDPQILFDMVTKLIVNTFTFENVGKKPLNEFEKKGIFTLNKFLALHQESTSLLPQEKLLQLLENLKIIAPFQEEGQEKFFIPCVLAHSEECESHSLPQSSGIPPMLITFKCGYCPKGLAGALIVYLLTNKEESKFKWILKTDQIFRNHISFLVSSCDIISLKIHPTFLELIHSSARKTSEEVIKKICNKTRQFIESGINQVSSLMNFTSSATSSIIFYCQSPVCNKSHPPHPATSIIEDDQGSVLLCHKLGGAEISDLPDGYSVWMQEEAAPLDMLSSNSEVLVIRSHGHNDKELDTNQIKDCDLYEATSYPNASLQIIESDGSKLDSHSEPKTAHVHRGAKYLEHRDVTRESNEETPKTQDLAGIVDGCDYAEIVGYLKIPNRSQIEELGAVLGLNVFELENMTNLPGDMVKAWLRKEGKVTEKSGDPLTWQVLIDALRKIGQTGVADDIERDKCGQRQ